MHSPRPVRIFAARLRIFIRLSPMIPLFMLPAGSAASPPQSTPKRIIDGSANPELIPDCRAYAMLFRVISNRSGDELAGIRSYLAEIGLGGKQCENCSAKFVDPNSQIDSLIAIGQEYTARVQGLAESARTRLERDPTLSEQSEIARLRQDTESVCGELVADLSLRLGPLEAEKVRLHIERIKRNMKIIEQN